MDAGSALTALQASLHWSADSWFGLAVGLLCGVPIGILSCRLRHGRRQAKGPPRHGFLHDLLALTPAIVACALWGVWLGIMAAKYGR
jgi:hypothetical protein